MRYGLATALGLLCLAAAAPAWAAPPPPGLVAAYSFDEGAGAVAVDASGNGHAGSIVGATWTGEGRYGGALSFDGTNDYVGLGGLGTFYRDGFTLQAWVRKATTKNDVAVVGTWAGSGPMLWVDHLASRYHLTLDGGLSSYLDSGRSPIVGTWQHLAATYDGATARFYVDGVEIASRAVAGGAGTSDVWRVGAYGGSPGGFFDGLVDDVRVYNRALSEAELQSDLATPVTIANAGAPTAPGSPAVTARTKTSLTLEWSASTDDVGVTGYAVSLDGVQVATTTATTFSFAGLSCSTSHELSVAALDGDDNASSPAERAGSTALCAGPVGLVASYSFDEGTGQAAADGSGNGHAGTISGASWTTAGRHGAALSFDGVDDHVALGALGSFSQSGFTLQAWVQKQSATKNDAAVVGSWAGSGPMLWVDHLATRYHLTVGSGYAGYLDSGVSPKASAWQHVAATYDGATARFYVGGVLVASRAAASVGSSDVWRIGAYGSSPGGFFDGVIDDVRIYDRPLGAGEIVVDMNQPAPAPDTTAPDAPGAPAANSPDLGRVDLAWARAEDDRVVTTYNVHRGTAPGFAPTAANRVGTPTGTAFIDTGVPTGTFHYRITAEDAAGNVGPASPSTAVTVAADETPPTVTLTAPATGTELSGVLTLSATAGDDHSLVGVQFRLDGVSLGAEDTTAPYSLSWDTRGEVNGAHVVTAVARDGGGNTTTSAASVTIENAGVSTAGLRAAYGFDESGGAAALDSSGNSRTATVVGGAWAGGRFGGAVSLNGTSAHVNPPALGTFYRTGFTLEAWVRKQTSKKDAAIVGAWVGFQQGGPMLWIDHITGNYRLTLGNTFANYLDAGVTPAVGTWQHVAATYDGSVARLYVDGVQRASAAFSGSVGSSTQWRIGAFDGSPAGFFDGLVDNVRIYDRALGAAEIQLDMVSRIQPDRTPPTVLSTVPAADATEVGVGQPIRITFDEPMQADTITSTTVQLRRPAGAVAAAVAYDAASRTVTLTPAAALSFSTRYTVELSAGLRDLPGNSLAPTSWSFTTEDSPPVLVVTAGANPFSRYLGEILLNEGLNAHTSIDLALVTSALLAEFDTVVLGEMPLTAAQVSMLTAWVNTGGNLVAMRPDKQLAPLLGLTDTGATLANGYLGAIVEAGITTATMQYHGTADRYTLSGATLVARLYTSATASTSNPAVTIRSVGSNGGQASAFTFDLARSVVYTRQGNPAWAGQDRDGLLPVRPNDLFYGAKAGDVQPDWLDTSKIAIPQADEQQRLLANLITYVSADRVPVPRFWYLPRGEKAALVLSGDDHSPSNAVGATAATFDLLKSLSPPGCVVAAWECARSSSYIYPDSPLTNAQASAYVGQGFEVGLHPIATCLGGTLPTRSELEGYFDSQLSAFAARYTGVPSPVSSRTHCVLWPDWATVPKVELARGIRLDANYYHYPAGWIGGAPGFMNGGGFPMRFADTDGTPIDVYQQHTNLTDESGQQYPAAVEALLDRALGAEAYYGAFGANIHTDDPSHGSNLETVVQAALSRGVPVVSYKQMLDWVDGRNGSKFSDVSWNAGALTFGLSVAAGATGLETMLPVTGPSGTLAAITRDGSPVPYALRTVKGFQYAVFAAANGTYSATYS